MNIRDALSDAAASLALGGVPNPRREAGTLLAFALSKESVFLLAHPEYELSHQESATYDEVVRRRAAREPFHLITGIREFFGHEFLVERGVLIPRPETELLVEQAITLMSGIPSPRFFEIGVGTGCVAVSILNYLPEAIGEAVDISAQALDLAKRNAESNHVSDRLDLRQSYLYEGLAGVFDAIVSNPPYIPAGDGASLEPEVLEFEPPAALFSGEDGLDLICRIIEGAPGHLRPGGTLLLEIGAGQSGAVLQLLETGGWLDLAALPDLRGISRVVTAKRSA